jgi:phosphate transport system permease protein
MSAITQSTTAQGTGGAKPRAARRSPSHIWDRVATAALWALALAMIGLLSYLFLYVLAQGVGLLSWRFITTTEHDGVGPQLFNTFYMLALALAMSAPVALGSAIYLTQYARQGPLITAVRFAAETLAGIPSLVLGLFGFLLFVTNFGEGQRLGFSRLAGAATLAILNLPLLMRVFEDGLTALPRELREGSLAVGATRYQTVWRVLMPAALPALTTGIVLTAGKMIGETAALIYTAGSNSGGSSGWFSLNPLLPGDTLSVHIFFLTAENPTASAALASKATSALLIILLLTFNLGFRHLAEALNRRLRGQEAARRVGWLAWLSSR